MAFLSKVGNMLRQTASKQLSSDFCAPKLSIYQAIRCMSSMASSKLFIGGMTCFHIVVPIMIVISLC